MPQLKASGLGVKNKLPDVKDGTCAKEIGVDVWASVRTRLEWVFLEFGSLNKTQWMWGSSWDHLTCRMNRRVYEEDIALIDGEVV